MKKRIIIIAVNALLILALVACIIASGTIKGTLLSQQAAKAWAGQSGERYAQVSAFFPTGYGFTESSVRGLRSSVDAAILAASLEAPENGSLYTDAWSAEGKVSVTGTRGSATASAIGVGGDFFLFHPLYLRSGSYLMADDLMKDRVVLDEELAWRLFGSVDLAGLQVTIGGEPYLIAGVVSREDDFASTAAYTGGAGLFMSYEALNKLSETEINCYEIVLSDPITGFALKTMQEALPSEDVRFVENSARYKTSALFGVLGDFGKRSMRMDNISYPYWENAARYTEDWVSLLLLMMLLLALCPVVCAVIYAVKAIKYLTHRGKTAAMERIEEKEQREAEKYELEHPEEFVVPDVEDIVREVLEEQKREEEEKESSFF